MPEDKAGSKKGMIDDWNGVDGLDSFPALPPQPAEKRHKQCRNRTIGSRSGLFLFRFTTLRLCKNTMIKMVVDEKRCQLLFDDESDDVPIWRKSTNVKTSSTLKNNPSATPTRVKRERRAPAVVQVSNSGCDTFRV
jgi:hypothetical protein